jgi:hypothetical protein
VILVALLALLAGLAGLKTAPAPVPVPIGAGTRYHPPPGAHRVPGLHCARSHAPRYGVHLELFTAGRVVIVPAGIGIAPPRRRDGAYVRGGRCSYPVRTREPTGVLEVTRGSGLTLGQLFAVWGRPLPGRGRLYVDGTRRRGDPATMRLRRHAEIVIEVGRHVRPHSFYRFPKGL